MRAVPVELDVDVVAVSLGAVEVVAQVAVSLVAVAVLAQLLHPRPPGVAVEDQALDSHAPGERADVAVAVGRQQGVDEAVGGPVFLGDAGVEVPVDRAALGVEAVVVAVDRLSLCSQR